MRRVALAALLAANGWVAGTAWAQCTLQYNGGPVLSNVRVHAVYWTSAVDSTEQGTIAPFYVDLMDAGYLDWLSEYNTQGVIATNGDAGTSQGISRGTLASITTLATPALCASATAGSPCTLAESDVVTELTARIADHTLPSPTPDLLGYAQDDYVVLFPPYVTITLPPSQGGGSSCSTFCYVHDAASLSTGQSFPFTLIPDMGPASPCHTGCGGSGTVDSLTVTLSHVLGESVTDPFPLTQSAWYAQQNGGNFCGEIGDICSNPTQSGTISVGADTWTVQKLWSNTLNNCVLSNATVRPICTAPGTPVGCRACSYSDDGLACTGATPLCEVDVANAHVGTCVQCRASGGCGSNATCNRATDTCVVLDAGPVQDSGSVAPDGGHGQDAGSADGGSGASAGHGCGCSQGLAALPLALAAILALATRKRRNFMAGVDLGKV